MNLIEYKVKITMTEDMLGTVPKNKDIFGTHIQKEAVDKGIITQEQADQEIESVEQLEEKGWTGFMKDDKGVFLFDYVFRGFLKASAKALSEMIGMKAVKSKVDMYLFVNPRKLYLTRDGKNIKEADGTMSRSLRSEGPRGPRVFLAKSDVVKAGAEIDLMLRVLPSKDKDFSLDTIKELLDYGELQGLGQFRNGSYGRFTYTIEEMPNNAKIRKLYGTRLEKMAKEAAAMKEAKGKK